jgi:hypothetical protein
MLRMIQCEVPIKDKNLFLFAQIPHLQSLSTADLKELNQRFDGRIPLLKSDARQIVLRMFRPISIQHGWIALTFLMNLVRVSERLYFNAVFAIAKALITSFGKMEPISILVFPPLVRAISNRAQGGEDEIAFLAAVERRRLAKVRAPQPDITFPLLNLELKLNGILFLLLDERFRQTPTLRLIERKIAKAESELRRLKEDIAVHF